MLLGLLTAAALADSPLTSIDLSTPYASLPAVQRARAGSMDHRTVDFLLSDAPFDQKLAVMDALGWSLTGQDHAGPFAQALAKRRGVKPEALRPQDLSANEKLVLGFLLAKDRYADLAPLEGSGTGLDGVVALDLLGEAAKAIPDDFSVQLAWTLVRAQAAMGESWCDVWRAGDELFARFPESRRNLKRDAVQSASDYLALYQSDCPDPELLPREVPTDPELDQIYAITSYRGQIVTATQGGVVFWGPQGAVAARRERVCTDLVPSWDGLWVGCQGRLLRWDGAAWTVEMEGAGGFALELDPKGQLHARTESQSWVRDADGLWRETKGEIGYDLAWRADGTLWRIDFLSSITGGDRQLKLRSDAYPGSDPRRFVVDPNGKLWVEDFEKGVFLYDDDRARFVPIAPVTSRAAGIAVDPAHQRTWFLHYTDGVWLVEAGQQPRFVDLRKHEHLRAIWLDERGEPWIAGYHGLVHLVPTSSGWAPEVRSVIR
jgi:hypothetical protein